MKDPHAVALGRKGGLVKSERKAAAARVNAIKRDKRTTATPSAEKQPGSTKSATA